MLKSTCLNRLPKISAVAAMLIIAFVTVFIASPSASAATSNSLTNSVNNYRSSNGLSSLSSKSDLNAIASSIAEDMAAKDKLYSPSPSVPGAWVDYRVAAGFIDGLSGGDAELAKAVISSTALGNFTAVGAGQARSADDYVYGVVIYVNYKAAPAPEIKETAAPKPAETPKATAAPKPAETTVAPKPEESVDEELASTEDGEESTVTEDAANSSEPSEATVSFCSGFSNVTSATISDETVCDVKALASSGITPADLSSTEITASSTADDKSPITPTIVILFIIISLAVSFTAAQVHARAASRQSRLDSAN